MSRSLVLNATYEPLGVVPDRRALILVLNSRATMVESSGEVLRFATGQLELLQLFDSINLFEFHIDMQSRYLVVRSLLAMVVDAFTVERMQLLLIM